MDYEAYYNLPANFVKRSANWSWLFLDSMPVRKIQSKFGCLLIKSLCDTLRTQNIVTLKISAWNFDIFLRTDIPKKKRKTFDFDPSLEGEVSKIYGPKMNDLNYYFFVIGTLNIKTQGL